MKLLFIGALNQNDLPTGGEEFKNRLIVSKIRHAFRQNTIIDTYKWERKPIILLQIIYFLFVVKHESVVLSVSSKSAYKLLMVVKYCKPSILNKITYIVVGGYLPVALELSKFNWRVYSGLKGIILQGEFLRQKVEKYTGLKNIKVVSNFKRFNFDICGEKKIVDKFKFVFLGRITSEKGVIEILNAVQILRKQNYDVFVDFYGVIIENFSLNTECSEYCGYLDFLNNPDTSYGQLSNYSCLLFPTYWKGEGFPGVVLDAFIAGLPVIASNWNMNSELIVEGENGFLVDPRNVNDLVEKMKYLVDNKYLVDRIRAKNKLKSKDYHIEKVWPQIEEIIRN